MTLSDFLNWCLYIKLVKTWNLSYLRGYQQCHGVRIVASFLCCGKISKTEKEMWIH